MISGYLITTLIAADLDAGRFSIAQFWERRIRRIWPAALVVTIGALVAGWFVSLPQDYRALANDASAQVAMLANVRFWLKTNYFADWADLDPLLHMWSLAVEEQFYVFLPVLMMVAWPFGRRACTWMVLSLAVASLAASVLLIGRYPMAVFFLLPFRAWELLLGSLLALVPLRMPRGKLLPNVLGGAGLAMILHPCLAYDRSTTFPGLAAIEPCLGAATLIAAGSGVGAAVNGLLEAPILRFVGRMSYSIYLWHWPLLAFLRYGLTPTLPPLLVLAAMVCLAVFSYASYRWIESPLRAAATPRARTRVVVSAVVASLAILGCSLVIRRFDGFPSRFPDSVLSVLTNLPWCIDWESNAVTPAGTEIVLKPIGGDSEESSGCFLLWGDSHGMAISPVVDTVARELGVSGHAALRRGCLPLPGRLEAVRHKKVEGRSAWYDDVAAWIENHRPKHIILIARWAGYASESSPDGIQHQEAFAFAKAKTLDVREARAAMKEDFSELIRVCERTHATLWLLLEVPYQPKTPRERALSGYWSGSAPSMVGIDRATHERRVNAFRELVESIDSPRCRVVDLAIPFFGDSDWSIVGRDGFLWYADDDHLSPSGAHAALEPTIRSILERIAEDRAAPAEGDAATTNAVR